MLVTAMLLQILIMGILHSPNLLKSLVTI